MADFNGARRCRLRNNLAAGSHFNLVSYSKIHRRTHGHIQLITLCPKPYEIMFAGQFVRNHMSRYGVNHIRTECYKFYLLVCCNNSAELLIADEIIFLKQTD